MPPFVDEIPKGIQRMSLRTCAGIDKDDSTRIFVVVYPLTARATILKLSQPDSIFSANAISVHMQDQRFKRRHFRNFTSKSRIELPLQTDW